MAWALAFLLLSGSPMSAASVDKDNKPSAFDLIVQFSIPPFKDKVEIKVRITPDQPFAGPVVNDKEGNSYNIAGMLLPKKSGRYRLVLTYLRWTDKQNNGMGTTVPELEVGVPSNTMCSVDGVMHDCISVTLANAMESK